MNLPIFKILIQKAPASSGMSSMEKCSPDKRQNWSEYPLDKRKRRFEGLLPFRSFQAFFCIRLLCGNDLMEYSPPVATLILPCGWWQYSSQRLGRQP
ncbi:MAG: hypothetical protein LBV41_01785 [Cytophagaceae bacterium]|nr:hypothetical protein [Cytophagaceae bacterium]